MEQIRFLIFDADDTLWKNNLYFESARYEFIKLCEQYSPSTKSFDRIFDEFEWQVVRERGYGSRNFIFILETLYDNFSFLKGSTEARKSYHDILNKFTQHTSRPPELFEGVQSILKKLSKKYSLFVLTKGDSEEQTRKLVDSNLAPLFRKAFVVPEKNVNTYYEILMEQQWSPDTVCMIGNSPKSDINPALQAGMWAVYIPYPYTWKLDDEPLQKIHPRLTEIEKFGDLGRFFS